MTNPCPPLRRSTVDKASSLPWYLAKPIIHRGLHNIFDGVIEQSRLSIRRAIAAGLPIEVDVESSIDDRSFIIHDPILDKLTNGSGRLRNLTAAKIRSFSLNCTDGEPIMVLEELLDLVDGRVPLILEFKNRELAVPAAIGNAASLLENYRGEFAVSSFSPILVEWFRDRCPGFTRGLVTTDTDTLEGRDPFMVCMLRNRLQPHFIAHQWCQLNCWTYQWVLEQDVPIIAWTVRDDDDWDVARGMADNMMFEFVAPDRCDWRRRSSRNWRAELGEGVDRRRRKNQPAYLKHDQFKGPAPWWTKNRSWAPAHAPKPAPAGAETAASYDSPLLLLSVFENKRDPYKSDPHFREAWADWKLQFSGDAIPMAQRCALLLLRPDARRNDGGRRALDVAEQLAFAPAAWFEVPLDRSACHGLMRYEWSNAGVEQLAAELPRLTADPLAGVFVIDSAPANGVPASVRLSLGLWEAGLCGPVSQPSEAACIACTEPADMIRNIGALLDSRQRREMFSTLQIDAARPSWQSLRARAHAEAHKCIDGPPAPAHPALADRAAPFAALTAPLAARLWASRAVA